MSKWHLTWKCMQRSSVLLNFSMKVVGEIALNDIHWYLLNVYGDHTMNVRTVRWWIMHFSSGNRDMCNKPHSGQHCTTVNPQNEKHLDQLICARLQPGNCVWNWILASMCWDIKVCIRWVPHNNRKMTKCKFVRSCWTSTIVKVTVV